MEVKQVKVTAAAAEAATSSWSELPADLIGQVLLRLPSLADRVRLRAACRPWRTDAKRQAALPPPLPWFALRDGGLVDHHGAPVRRCAPILREGVTDYLAVDNLAFLAHNRAACCSMVNPLSASEETPLPQLANAVLRAMNDSKFYTVGNTKMPYVKVILSSPPLDSSPDPLVAALIFEGYYVAISACNLPRFRMHQGCSR
ncbi:hypothetical protein EE612_060666 [Oryza sativa]|nr:hypothetical protein EE612_060666 [Oryza sativa]